MAKKSDTESEWLFYLILALLTVSLFVNAFLLSRAPASCPAEKVCDYCGGNCAQGQSCVKNNSMSYSCLTVCDVWVTAARVRNAPPLATPCVMSARPRRPTASGSVCMMVTGAAATAPARRHASRARSAAATGACRRFLRFNLKIAYARAA